MPSEILAENIAFDENGLYIPQTWLDGVGEGNFTPLTADRMNHIEQGIKGLSDAWDSQSQIRHISVDNDRSSLLIYGKLAILNLEFTTIYEGKWTTIFDLPEGIEADFESLPNHAYTAALSVRDSSARGGLAQIPQNNPTKVQTYGGYGGKYWCGQLVFLIK